MHERLTWEIGDTLKIGGCHTWSGHGLDYDAQIVAPTEPGFSGGWDVFDAYTLRGEELSFYGFSVIEVHHATR